MRLEFNTLKFFEEGDKVKVRFMKYFYFYFSEDELKKIGKYKVNKEGIEFFSEKKTIESNFYFLLEKKFRDLKTIIDDKPTLYIHKNSGIPIIGSNSFGIVDRGTNVIELKPITICNLDCVYCSVDNKKRDRNIVVEKDYLIESLIDIVSMKENPVHIHIGGQGEPTMYSDLVDLIRDIRMIRNVKFISIATNGVLLTKEYVKRLIAAGLTHFHMSLNSMTQETADLMAGNKYPLKKNLRIAEYIVENANLIIAPLWVPSINDDEIEGLIEFSKKIGAYIGIQNYLGYKFGKKPVNQLPMKLFLKKLDDIGKKLGVDLFSVDPDYKIVKDKKIKKPIRKRELIKVELIAEGRFSNTMIGSCCGRAVTVIDCNKKKGVIKARVIRDKDNVFVAVPA